MHGKERAIVDPACVGTRVVKLKKCPSARAGAARVERVCVSVWCGVTDWVQDWGCAGEGHFALESVCRRQRADSWDSKRGIHSKSSSIRFLKPEKKQPDSVYQAVQWTEMFLAKTRTERHKSAKKKTSLTRCGEIDEYKRTKKESTITVFSGWKQTVYGCSFLFLFAFACRS